MHYDDDCADMDNIWFSFHQRVKMKKNVFKKTKLAIPILL